MRTSTSSELVEMDEDHDPDVGVLWTVLPLLGAIAAVVNLLLGIKVGPVVGPSVDVLAIVLAGGTVGALALNRNSPRLALALVVLGSMTYTLRGYPTHPGQFVIGVALFLAVIRGEYVLATVVGLFLTIAAAVRGAELVDADSQLMLARVAMISLPSIPLIGGLVVWSYNERVRALRGQAELAEKKAQAEVARDSARQRIAIARELHDSVGHSMAVISVQSGAALQVVEHDPDSAKAALQIINDSCRQAMVDTKHALSSLREGASWSAPSVEATVLTALDAGLEVEFAQSGSIGDVDSQVRNAVRRIAQESLTNTLRHANARRVDVVLDVREDELRLIFRDDGGTRWDGTGERGSGISGMAQRVRELGGAFRAEPGRDGFEVEVTIPTSPMRSTSS